MTLPARYEAMRATAKLATPGPWRLSEDPWRFRDDTEYVYGPANERIVEINATHSNEDAAHITAANPAAVFQLLTDFEEAVRLLRHHTGDCGGTIDADVVAFLARIDNDKEPT